jgi:hypothetical protein
MSSVVISGNTSGTITLDAPAVAGTTTLTLPATSGTVITTGSTFAGTGPAFSAYADSSQNSISNATFTKVAINTEIFDTNNNFDSTTNYRFTPTVAGYYQINGNVRLTTTGATAFLCAIFKNGVEYAAGMQLDGVAATTMQLPVSEVIYFNGSTDYVELYGYVASSGTKNINFAASYVTSRFSGVMVRSA